jgi:hypothetical protein
MLILIHPKEWGVTRQVWRLKEEAFSVQYHGGLGSWSYVV